MENKLEQVRAKVIEAVPEIVRLVPGCVLESQAYPEDGYFYTLVAGGGKCRKHKTARGCENADGTCDIDSMHLLIRTGELYDDFGWLQEDVWADDIEDPKQWKVIGRSITLADVLRAIEGVDNGTYFLDVQGGWWKWNKSGVDPEFLGMGKTWNLSLPLDEQEPEVIEFLHKILCV